MLTTPNPKKKTPHFLHLKNGGIPSAKRDSYWKPKHHFWMLVFWGITSVVKGFFVVEWWATCFFGGLDDLPWPYGRVLSASNKLRNEFFVKPQWGDDALGALGSANGRCDLRSGNWGGWSPKQWKTPWLFRVGDFSRLTPWVSGKWDILIYSPHLALQGLESLPILSRLPQLRVGCLMWRREVHPLIWMMRWR